MKMEGVLNVDEFKSSKAQSAQERRTRECREGGVSRFVTGR